MINLFCSIFCSISPPPPTPKKKSSLLTWASQPGPFVLISTCHSKLFVLRDQKEHRTPHCNPPDNINNHMKYWRNTTLHEYISYLITLLYKHILGFTCLEMSKQKDILFILRIDLIYLEMMFKIEFWYERNICSGFFFWINVFLNTFPTLWSSISFDLLVIMKWKCGGLHALEHGT